MPHCLALYACASFQKIHQCVSAYIAMQPLSASTLLDEWQADGKNL